MNLEHLCIIKERDSDFFVVYGSWTHIDIEPIYITDTTPLFFYITDTVIYFGGCRVFYLHNLYRDSDYTAFLFYTSLNKRYTCPRCSVIMVYCTRSYDYSRIYTYMLLKASKVTCFVTAQNNSVTFLFFTVFTFNSFLTLYIFHVIV